MAFKHRAPSRRARALVEEKFNSAQQHVTRWSFATETKPEPVSDCCVGCLCILADDYWVKINSRQTGNRRKLSRSNCEISFSQREESASVWAGIWTRKTINLLQIYHIYAWVWTHINIVKLHDGITGSSLSNVHTGTSNSSYYHHQRCNHSSRELTEFCPFAL